MLNRVTTFENHLLMFASFVCYFISYNKNYVLHLIFLLRLEGQKYVNIFSRSCLKQSVSLQFIRLPVFQLNTRKVIYNSFKTFSDYVPREAMTRGNYFMKTLTCMNIKNIWTVMISGFFWHQRTKIVQLIYLNCLCCK